MPDKLAHAVKRLQTPKPALYGSHRINCSVDLTPMPTAASRVTPSFANALVQRVGIEPSERFAEAALLSELPGGRRCADLA